MPIHAAGIHDGESPICVSDFFVSSYTPTLQSLVDARNRPDPSSIQILPIIQPDPGSQFPAIPFTRVELHEIAEAVPTEKLMSLGEPGDLDFNGDFTTVQRVTEKLPEATVVHFACHGVQDVDDPLQSAFILRGEERLTVAEIMKEPLPNAYLAILNACNSGASDAEQPDEAINLANAMLFAGFRTIMATMW